MTQKSLGKDFEEKSLPAPIRECAADLRRVREKRMALQDKEKDLLATLLDRIEKSKKKIPKVFSLEVGSRRIQFEQTDGKKGIATSVLEEVE